MAAQSTESCSWCGNAIEREDGWRVQGPFWEAGEIEEPSGVGDSSGTCSHCGAELGDVRVLLVRHRGEHRIPDAFCSAGHMSEWAKAGGRWA
jgi:hypothetical protein